MGSMRHDDSPRPDYAKDADSQATCLNCKCMRWFKVEPAGPDEERWTCLWCETSRVDESQRKASERMMAEMTARLEAQRQRMSKK